jgi:outer membrane protein TolC
MTKKMFLSAVIVLGLGMTQAHAQGILGGIKIDGMGYAQELTSYRLSMEQVIELGLQHHQQLKIAEAKLNAAEQQIQVAKLQQLPSISFSANAFYLGNAVLLDTDWSKLQTVEMPHFGNTFGLQASQLLYKGGVIRKSIGMTVLQQQLAELDLSANEQDVKFLIISNFLDIQKLINQIEILKQNRALAEQLLENITTLYEQEMVTKNELIRAELQIKNLNQNILAMENGHAILSNQLSYALGLPDNVLIVPAGDIVLAITLAAQSYYSDLALQHPVLQSAGKHIEIAEKGVDLTKTDWYPAVSAFAGYNIQRPLTSSTPVMDLYNNTWQAGISLNFSLDGLYKNSRKINHSKSQVKITQEALTYAQQQVEIGVNAAFLKYREAERQTVLMDESRRLANENYEIVRNKYLNQLAITAEMTDASNAKLNAELQHTNAVLNAIFQYYSLLKSTGTL